MNGYLLLGEVRGGNYETLDYCEKQNLREAEKYFKGKNSYLSCPKRIGRVIIVKINKRVKWYGN